MTDTLELFLKLEKVSAEFFDAASREEAIVTQFLTEIAERCSGYFEGLEFRLKEKPSLQRKILVCWNAENTLAKPKDIKSVALDKVTDALRYTLIFPTEKYTQGVRVVLDELAAAGYGTFELRNYWLPNNAYRGINAIFFTLTEKIKFELQLHTPESFDMKQNHTHSYYERFRVESQPAVKYSIFLEMCQLFEDVPTPEGILNGDFGIFCRKDMQSPDEMEKEGQAKAITEARQGVERTKRMEQSIRMVVHSLHKDAEAEEPTVTADVVATAERYGGRAEKLQTRLKTKGSLHRKISSEIQATMGRISLLEVSADVIDSLRYMLVFSLENYTRGVSSFLDAIQEQGYIIRPPTRNFWKCDAKDSAIKIVLLSKSRLLKVEVQMHTPESILQKLQRYSFVKWVEGGLVEVGLNQSKQDEFLDQMFQYQKTMQSVVANISVPVGVEEIGTLEKKGKDYVAFVYRGFRGPSQPESYLGPGRGASAIVVDSDPAGLPPTVSPSRSAGIYRSYSAMYNEHHESPKSSCGSEAEDVVPPLQLAHPHQSAPALTREDERLYVVTGDASMPTGAVAEGGRISDLSWTLASVFAGAVVATLAIRFSTSR